MASEQSHLSVESEQIVKKVKKIKKDPNVIQDLKQSSETKEILSTNQHDLEPRAEIDGLPDQKKETFDNLLNETKKVKKVRQVKASSSSQVSPEEASEPISPTQEVPTKIKRVKRTRKVVLGSSEFPGDFDMPENPGLDQTAKFQKDAEYDAGATNKAEKADITETLVESSPSVAKKKVKRIVRKVDPGHCESRLFSKKKHPNVISKM